MAIVKSEIVSNNLQAHGVQEIEECHTDYVGEKHYFHYSVEDGTDLQARIENRVKSIEEQIKQREIDNAISLIEQDKAVVLNWSEWSEIKPHLQQREIDKTEDISKETIKKNNISDKIAEIDGDK